MPSTPPSSVSRSPYASFFDIFACGCTSDVTPVLEDPHKKQSILVHHDASYDVDVHEGEEFNTESAKEYLERIRKNRLVHTKIQREHREDSSSPRPNRSTTQIGSKMHFEIATPPRYTGSYLKQSDSDSTQSTQAMSDDSDDDDCDSRDGCEAPKPVSILRRKETLRPAPATSGGAVRFAACTVFSDPNVPQVRKRVRRLTREERYSLQQANMILQPHLSPILAVATVDQQDDRDDRRKDRRAQQKQNHRDQIVRSQSIDLLLSGSDDIYAFR